MVRQFTDYKDTKVPPLVGGRLKKHGNNRTLCCNTNCPRELTLPPGVIQTKPGVSEARRDIVQITTKSLKVSRTL